MNARNSSGSRAGRSGLSITVVAAGLLPAAMAGALALSGRSSTDPEPARAPSEAPLRVAVTACPPGPQGSPGSTVRVLSAPAGSGEVRLGKQAGTVSPGKPAQSDQSDAVIVRAEGEAAPGLLAGRTTRRDGLSSVSCLTPRSEAWFTGVGAGPTRQGALHLVNPDAGEAVVDVAVSTARGAREVNLLRGVVVEGGQARELDLSKLAPESQPISVRVQVDRGRVSPFLADTSTEVASDYRDTEWMAPQSRASSTVSLIGVPTSKGERQLALTNPGDSEVSAQVRLRTAESTFAPTGIDPVRVPAGETVVVDVADALNDTAASKPVGVLVEASGPIAGSLRSVAEGEVSLQGPAEDFATSGALLPAGKSRIDLTAGSRCASDCSVRLTAYDARGKRVDSIRTKLGSDRLFSRELPASAASVVLEGSSVRGAVVTTAPDGARNGAATTVLGDLATAALTPDAAPAPQTARR